MTDMTAAAIRRAGQVVVVSSSTSSNGLGEFNGWFRRLSADCSDAELGAAVQAAFQESARLDGFTTPPLSRDRADSMQPVYADLGVRDEREFTDGAASVELDLIDDVLYVQPMLNDLKRGGGFTAFGGGSSVEPVPQDAELGRLIREGWDARDLPDHRSGEPSHT